MCKSLRGENAGELVTGASAERAPGAREHEACDLVGRGALQALKDRRMLAVDGQDPAAAAVPGGEGEVAGRYKALLVREREVDAALERPERRMDAGEADDRVQNDVGLCPLEQLRQVAPDLLQRRVDLVER